MSEASVARVAPMRNVVAADGASGAASGGADGATGDFVLGGLLGRGGMGLVFRAGQAGLERGVALKTILPDHAGDQNARGKFLSEARVTGQLEHPNIVPVYELAQAPDGSLFYTMKEVRGRAWSKALPTLSEADNIDILLKVADAVAFAHGRGVIHRDLKPENVMLGDFGEVLLMDWGLAVGVTDAAKAQRLSPANARGGTPAYMAPEMAAADAEIIGPASDIYLLGAILYEILTGLRPHHGADVFGCLYSALKNTLQPAERKDEWMEVASRALSTDPRERHADVKTFQRALRDCREHGASRSLSGDARATLKRAMRGGNYTDYAQAAFGFGEALRLWPGNQSADLGLTATRKHYAEAALERGDFDLALTQAKSIVGDAGDLRRRIESAKAERERRRERLRRLTRLSALLAGLLVVVGALSYWRVSRAERRRVAALEAEHRARAEQARLSMELAYAARKLGLWGEAENARLALTGASSLTAASEGALAAAVGELAPWPEELLKRARILTQLSFLASRYEDFEALLTAFGRLADAAEAAGDADLTAKLRIMVQLLNLRREQTLASASRPPPPDFDSSELVRSPLSTIVGDGLRADAERRRRADQARLTIRKQREEAINTQLRRDNPGYTGSGGFTWDNDQIVAMRLDGNQISNIEALRGLALREVEFYGSGRRNDETMDLSPLMGMPLARLTATGARFSTLAPLIDSPLDEIQLFQTSFPDLESLRGKRIRSFNIYNSGSTRTRKGLDGIVAEELDVGLMVADSWAGRWRTRLDLKEINTSNLKVLRATGCGLKDLSPLRGVPLLQLDIGVNQVADLSPLAGMPLEVLRCAGNEISDLAPLAGMPLRELDLTGNRVVDLTPLREAPLVKLNADYNEIADISVLAGREMEELLLAHNRIRDYTPLSGLSAKLLRFDPDPSVPGIEGLRNNPRIGVLSLCREKPSNLGKSEGDISATAKQFWEDFDRGGMAEYIRLRRAFEEANPGFREAWRRELWFVPIIRRGELAGITLGGPPIRDFSPLFNTSVKEIDLSYGRQGDLGIFRGMTFKRLDLRYNNFGLDDVSTLLESPIEDLRCDKALAEKLAGARNIAKINGIANPEAVGAADG